MSEFQTINVNLSNLSEEERKSLMGLIKKANQKPEECLKSKKNDAYYLITGDSKIIENTEGETIYEFDNYFKTKEEAEFAKQKQLVYQDLKRYALEHNTEKIDWENYSQIKYFICCNTKSNDLRITDIIVDVFEMKMVGQVYFTSEEIAQEAVKTVGEDRIKKYLFGID